MKLLSCDGVVSVTESGPECSGTWAWVDPATMLSAAPDPEAMLLYLSAGLGTGIVIYGGVFAIRAILALIMSR